MPDHHQGPENGSKAVLWRRHDPPRVVVHGVGARGWFFSYLSLAAWARHGAAICRNCEVVSVELAGDLAFDARPIEISIEPRKIGPVRP